MNTDVTAMVSTLSIQQFHKGNFDIIRYMMTQEHRIKTSHHSDSEDNTGFTTKMIITMSSFVCSNENITLQTKTS